MKKVWKWPLMIVCILHGAAVGASDLGTLLGGGGDQFRKALPGQPIRLPADHGAHPETHAWRCLRPRFCVTHHSCTLGRGIHPTAPADVHQRRTPAPSPLGTTSAGVRNAVRVG